MKRRGKVHFEKAKKRSERDKLVITEIPYTMIGANISKFIADVVGLSENKTTSDIVDVSNESSKEGIRIVLELRRNADVERLENLLYKKTRLEDTFGVNMLAIANGRPELLSLTDIISYHTRFHYEVLTRKYETLLKLSLIHICTQVDYIYYNSTVLSGGQLIGADSHYLGTCGYVMKRGRGFTESDYEKYRKVAVVDLSLIHI